MYDYISVVFEHLILSCLLFAALYVIQNKCCSCVYTSYVLTVLLPITAPYNLHTCT